MGKVLYGEALLLLSIASGCTKKKSLASCV